MKKLLIVIAVSLLGFAAANATAIKTWTTEVLRYQDLNSNFSHLHDNMVGGHGARLVNADVSTSAAIAHTKLATPALIPKAWGVVGLTGACSGAAAAGTPCTVDASSGVTAVKSNGTTGEYRVDLSFSPANAVYSVMVSSLTRDDYCVVDLTSLALQATSGDANGTNFIISCETDASADANAVFSFMIFDNDN